LKEKSGLLAGFFFALCVVIENPTGILFDPEKSGEAGACSRGLRALFAQKNSNTSISLQPKTTSGLCFSAWARLQRKAAAGAVLSLICRVACKARSRICKPSQRFG
jgi:hypothetical protein